jgi:hypothetical protein
LVVPGYSSAPAVPGVDAPPLFSPSFVSNETGHFVDVQDWEIETSFNQPPTFRTGTGIRILQPDDPDTSYPHSFLYPLPVESGLHSATWGNGLDTILEAGLHNAYNCTVIEASFGVNPWYADNAVKSWSLQETFMKELAAWATTSEFASGGERHCLIGFSKSGLGAQSLQFRNPDVWSKTASWDAPFMMNHYKGDDPAHGRRIGGGSKECYGTAANFRDNYQLSSANLTEWADASDFATVSRMWIGGYCTFGADVVAYKSLLGSLGILFDGSRDTLCASHDWHEDWVSAALAFLFARPEPRRGGTYE